MLTCFAFAMALLRPHQIAPTALGQAAEQIDDDRASRLFRAMEQRLAKAVFAVMRVATTGILDHAAPVPRVRPSALAWKAEWESGTGPAFGPPVRLSDPPLSDR
jgi:hypothetical protein